MEVAAVVSFGFFFPGVREWKAEMGRRRRKLQSEIYLIQPTEVVSKSLNLECISSSDL